MRCVEKQAAFFGASAAHRELPTADGKTAALISSAAHHECTTTCRGKLATRLYSPSLVAILVRFPLK